ncbi:helix-turn-helix transcriptional regulator [Mycoplasmatota bacterium]|nr:helix-turn-helix transcriptional regulator [Mycoplasmatota bacterium]
MRLKQIRKKLNLKQEDIAKIINLKRNNISRIENGIQTLNNEQIVEICKTLKISADYLLGLVDENTENE